MSAGIILEPDYIFEVSWEVCNKVGGIYTVLATKAQTLEKGWHERLIMIGPDVWKGTGEHPEFLEDKTLFKLWRQYAEQEGLKIKIGRWNIPGKPIAVLVDFTPFFLDKNEIFKDLWINYQLDSLTGQWDYIEPAIFGYAAGRVIDCFYRCHINFTDKVVAQFHEWMTGAGILYLQTYAPQIATVFTTHATVLGRSIAGNGLPFYKDFNTYIPEDTAKSFNVISKHSLEKVAAKNADCFTTVSNITGDECKKFLEKSPDIVTPNGFDISIVPNAQEFAKKRSFAREKVIRVASALFNQQMPEDSLLVIKSGRYEFKNKGIDIFIDSLGELNNHLSPSKNIIAVIFVPGHQTGPRKELLDRLQHPQYTHPNSGEVLTHNLQGADSDPILQRIREQQLNNSSSDKVKIIFVPTYMNGEDGIFNLSYYDLLIGFDIAVFPSYYEPWGYTPLESIAFHIPAITTNISGFGAAIHNFFQEKQKGIYIVNRNDENEKEVVKEVARIIYAFADKQLEEIQQLREEAYSISLEFLWDKQIEQYKKAYHLALQKSSEREILYRNKPQATPIVVKEMLPTKPMWRDIIIQSVFPEALLPLQKLSRNLWWSWNDDAIDLFEYIDLKLWKKCHRNPIVFLQSLNYAVIKKLAGDKDFLNRMNIVFQRFDQYMNTPLEVLKPSIAYFSMEYGLQNCLKLYSGGLGVLAGDYLKEASDRGMHVTGIGLLYKHGYFRQSLSVHGAQLANAEHLDIATLPLDIVADALGKPVKIALAFPGRTLMAQVWKLAVGRVSLYLLDTYVEENTLEDRQITAHLYPSSVEHRLKQEILLGMGGIQLLNVLNVDPDIYHCNEGHAAFLGFGRLYNLIHHDNLSFEEAVEVTRATQLFTTHTSLPAAIDTFSEELLRPYFSHTAQQFNVSWETLMDLGRAVAHRSEEKFSMAYLASRLSKEINAVSKIHRSVSADLFNILWPDYRSEELHIGYVTNGVHYPTWVAKEWKKIYLSALSSLPAQGTNSFNEVSDDLIWDTRRLLKRSLLDAVRERLFDTLSARHEGPKKIAEAMEHLDERAFIIGFARRFVTYKRPNLLLSDINRLSAVLNSNNMPVLIFFSGKAHPNDSESAEFVRAIVALSEQPAFKNRIFFLEDYDMNLAKLLVQGADLWLNTPERHMEASGTSGMKAMMNGVLNFSVLDGWWAEAYQENIGWSLEGERTYDRSDFQNELDAENIYKALQNEIIPLYFKRNDKDIPVLWIQRIKSALAVASNYTMSRALSDYQHKYYAKLYEHGVKLKENNFTLAKQLAAWKKRIVSGWNELDVFAIESDLDRAKGAEISIKIVLDIGQLSADDIGIEIVFLHKNSKQDESLNFVRAFNITEVKKEMITFECKIPPFPAGAYEYCFRIFPKHSMLTHRQDFSLVKWI